MKTADITKTKENFKMKNMKIEFEWTKNFDIGAERCGFDMERKTDHIITDGDYIFDDYLSDNGVRFEHEDNIYFVIDDDGNRTGEAYRIVEEAETDEEITEE